MHESVLRNYKDEICFWIVMAKWCSGTNTAKIPLITLRQNPGKKPQPGNSFDRKSNPGPLHEKQRPQ